MTADTYSEYLTQEHETGQFYQQASRSEREIIGIFSG